MDAKKLIKNVIRVAPVAVATFGVLSLALSKYEEKQGNFSREFPDAENEIKAKIDEVRLGYGKEN